MQTPLRPSAAVCERLMGLYPAVTAAQAQRSAAAASRSVGCVEWQLSLGKVPSWGCGGPARHPSPLCWGHQPKAAASPAQPIPTVGAGSKWRWPRPRCSPGRWLPRRYRPQRRLPWCQDSGNGRYSPSASSRHRRTPSPNGGEEVTLHRPAKEQGSAHSGSPGLRVVWLLSHSCWAPAGGGVPLQVGDWDHQ